MEIERVVSPLTVTESQLLSCCQEKNTEAHINCMLTLFPFALYSPPATLPPSPHLTRFTRFYGLKTVLRVNVDLGPSLC